MSPSSGARDTEQVPIVEMARIESFFGREVLPHASEVSIETELTTVGYEVFSTRYFYKPPTLRTRDEIRADLLALEEETESLLSKIFGGGTVK